MKDYTPMDIYSPSGSKVRFEHSTDAQVSWGSHDDPDKHLERGKTYTVLRTEVHSMHTKLYLREFPELKFNTCSFSNV